MDDGVTAVMEHSQSLGLAVLLRSGSYCVSRKKNASAPWGMGGGLVGSEPRNGG
jgi:hypothetical protein